MPSNVVANPGADGATFVTKQVTHDGDSAQLQCVGILGVAGTEDSYTIGNIGGDATNGLDVDVTRSALPTGAATSALQTSSEALLTTIDEDTAAIVTAAQAIQTAVEILDNTVSGTETQVDVVAALPAGDNNIGNVDIVTLPTTVHSADFDTGGGTDTTLAFGIAVPASGGAAVVPGDATAGLKVNLGADNDVTVSGTVTVDGSGVTQPVSAASLPLPTGAATSANQTSEVNLLTTIDEDTAAMVTALQILDNVVSGSEAQVDVVAALPAGANAIGNVGVVPRTSGGMSIFRSLDIDESEEEIKATAGQVFSITAFNTTAAPLYLKFYNATAANVTVGTTTPVLTFLVPGNADSDGAGFIWNNDIGFAFATAITVACTTAIADNDTGAPGGNACLINVGYA